MNKQIYTVFGKAGCKYCQLAIELLERNQLQYDYVDVSQEATKLEMVLLLKSFDVVPKTVPQVVLGSNTYIGGYRDLLRSLGYVSF